MCGNTNFQQESCRCDWEWYRSISIVIPAGNMSDFVGYSRTIMLVAPLDAAPTAQRAVPTQNSTRMRPATPFWYPNSIHACDFSRHGSALGRQAAVNPP